MPSITISIQWHLAYLVVILHQILHRLDVEVILWPDFSVQYYTDSVQYYTNSKQYYTNLKQYYTDLMQCEYQFLPVKCEACGICQRLLRLELRNDHVI